MASVKPNSNLDGDTVRSEESSLGICTSTRYGLIQPDEDRIIFTVFTEKAGERAKREENPGAKGLLFGKAVRIRPVFRFWKQLRALGGFSKGRGRGELPRLMLIAAGQPFEDCRFGFGDFSGIKPNCPWGYVPVLEMDGKRLGDSVAIAKYIAVVHGLNGQDAWESALIDSVLQTSNDLFMHTREIFFAHPEPARKATLISKYRDETLIKFLRNLEFFIEQNGKNGHIVGTKLSAADVSVFNILDQAQSRYQACPPATLARYPRVKAVMDEVTYNERIARYLAHREEALF